MVVLRGYLHNFTVVDKSSWQSLYTLLLSHLLRINHLDLDNWQLAFFRHMTSYKGLGWLLWESHQRCLFLPPLDFLNVVKG